MQFLKSKCHNAIVKKCLVFAMLLLILTGCYAEAPTFDTSAKEDYYQPEILLTTADLTTECTAATHVDLTQIKETVYVVSEPGCYVLSGGIDGTVQVNVEDQIVHLVLNGVTVDSPYGPALEVVSASKVFITLQEGTENFLSDAAVYPETQDPDACIYSPCDMTINGSGTLHVYGYHKDAVHSKDTLKVLGGNVFVQSKRNGLRGNDGVVIRCESLNVQSEKNGIQSTKTGDGTKGDIEIYNSTCSVIGGNYAISCASDLYIADSEVYTLGILADMKVDGISRIAEGNLQHE